MKTKLEVIRLTNEDVIATSGNKCSEVAGFIRNIEGVWYYQLNNSDYIFSGNEFLGNTNDLDDDKMYHINNNFEIIADCPYPAFEDEDAMGPENHNIK